MQDVTGWGTSVTVVALQTFPQGFKLTQFADDKDPLTIEDLEPVGYEMLYDGNLFAYDKAAPVMVSVSVIPNTEDDINLKILLQTKKGGIRLLPISDVTSMVISYPDGGMTILSGGTILSGPPADSINQAGRKIGNTYKFVFASIAGAQSNKQTGATIIQNILGG